MANAECLTIVPGMNRVYSGYQLWIWWCVINYIWLFVNVYRSSFLLFLGWLSYRRSFLSNSSGGSSYHSSILFIIFFRIVITRTRTWWSIAGTFLTFFNICSLFCLVIRIFFLFAIRFSFLWNIGLFNDLGTSLITIVFGYF